MAEYPNGEGKLSKKTSGPEEQKKRELQAEFTRPVPADYKPLIEQPVLFVEFTSAHSNSLALDVADVFTLPHIGATKKDDELIQKIRKGELLPVGEALRPLLQGKDFIDLGCGHPELSRMPRIVAKELGAKRYIGVDKYLEDDPNKEMPVVGKEGYKFMNTVGPVSEKQENGFPSYWAQDDMLGFVAKIPRLDGVVFYISGIEAEHWVEPVPPLSVLDAYYKALLNEIQRLTKAGDAIVVEVGGLQTPFPHPLSFEDYGFREKKVPEARPPLTHRIYVRE